MAEDLGVKEQVHFLGYRTDIKELLKAGDIFLFTSKQEGLARSLMEAMASGLPVICSKIRGNVDLVDDGVNGILINNTVEEAVKAIKLIYTDSKLKLSLSKAEKEKITQFGLDNIRSSMIQIYDKIDN